ncbi:MAG: hypothetical protein V4525_10835 [Pseudomonadota bacterium]
MSLLQDIQEAIIKDDAKLGTIFLKLRLLAARLGSTDLEEWVKHESEGYPENIFLPEYRKIPVSYTGSFSGPLGSGIRNAPIPPYLIEKFAGKDWTRFEIRQSIAAIDDLIESTSSKNKGSLEIEAANLILLLQGKVYENYACNDVHGVISKSSLSELQHIVKSRVLELTIKLEKSIPAAHEVAFGTSKKIDIVTSEKVTQISNQVVYGNVMSINNSGNGSSVNISIQQGDQKSLEKYLKNAGLSEEDAIDLSTIVASETPESDIEPLGSKAKAWLVNNLKKATNGSWQVGVSVATEVIKNAVLKYYGIG